MMHSRGPPGNTRKFAERLPRHTQPKRSVPQKDKKQKPYESGRTRVAGRGYSFETNDPNSTHLGVHLRDHQRQMRRTFVTVAFVILVIEVLMLAWPITATVLWGLEAAINWVWFFYLLRALLLLWAILTSSSLAVEKLWGLGSYEWLKPHRVQASFAPSLALIGWSSLAFSLGCILGGVATILSAAIYTLYTSNLLYGLTLGFGVLSILESFIAPFVLYRFGVIVPVNAARNSQLQRMESNRYNMT